MNKGSACEQIVIESILMLNDFLLVQKITFGAPNCIWDAELLRSLSTVNNKVDTGPRKVSSAEQRFLRFQSGIDEGQIKVKQVWLLFFKSESHHITLAEACCVS